MGIMALTDNLIAYYKLDETSGSTAVDELATNDGTITGATVNQAGKIGTAYSFDGSGDRVSMVSGVSGNFTATCWVKAISNSSEGRILTIRGSSGSSAGICIASNPAIGSNGINSLHEIIAWGSTGGTNIYDSTWHFLTLTWDGTTSKLYLDGDSTPESTNSSSPSLSTQNYIGQHSSTTNTFVGTIDEVAIWSRVLSTDEITELYNSGSGITYPFLTYYSLTVNSVGLGTGNIVLNPSGGSYEEDTEVTITASVNDEDNRFYRYYGDVETTFENPITVTMTEDLVINCQFQKRTKIEDGVIF